MANIFTAADGYRPIDLLQCGADHIDAARVLFRSAPGHYDSAGYLVHIGIELILKAWLLEVEGQFDGTHNLHTLYDQLVTKHGAPALNDQAAAILKVLDQYERLRYPNPQQPIEIGDENLPEIDALLRLIAKSTPNELQAAYREIDPTRKAGRVLMKKPVKK